jgi:hypothetical protein
MLVLSDFKHDNPCKTPPNYDWVPWVLPSSAAPIVLNTEAEKAKGTADNELCVEADEVSEELLIDMIGEWPVSS